VVTYQGYILKSEEAVYLPDKQQILLPRPTTIASDGLESEGSSMEVELEEKKVRMLRNVKTKIEPAKLEANQKKTKMRQVTGE